MMKKNSSIDKSLFVLIAKIGKTRGLKGEFFLRSFAEKLESLISFKKFFSLQSFIMEEIFFEYIWKGWLCLASPVLSNTGTDRGFPISCFGIDVADNDNGTPTTRLQIVDGCVGINVAPTNLWDGTAVDGAANERLVINGWYGRSTHNNGGLCGSYNTTGNNGAKTNPIYVIGSNYKPNDDTLGNMYGVGYTHTAPPQVIIDLPPYKTEKITSIDNVEGFTGIITGIKEVTNSGQSGLKFFFRADKAANSLLVGYPVFIKDTTVGTCLLYTSPSPRDS